MDIQNPIVALCQQGSRAEFEGRPEAAAALYLQAWDQASDDYEAAMAAHYRARMQASPAESLTWHSQAITHALAAEQAGDQRIQEFFPSLWLSLAGAQRDCGETEQVRLSFERARAAAESLPGPVGELFRAGLAKHELAV